jgi:hypothetical protein
LPASVSRLATFVLVAFVSFVSCACLAAPATAASPRILTTGGLDAPETGSSLGPNLVANGDLRAGGLHGWILDSSCFTLDRSGQTPSLKLKVPCPGLYPKATNSARIPAGSYRISAEIKTDALVSGVRGGYGARIVLSRTPPARGWYFTKPALHGTHDWTAVYLPHVIIPEGSSGVFSAGLVRRVDSGTVQFRNLSVRRETEPPLQTFLLYPNYRGLMFSDSSQVARIAVKVTPPRGTPMSKLRVAIQVLDSHGKLLSTRSFSPPAAGSFVATADMASLPMGSYRLQGALEEPAGKHLFTQSSYTVVKVSTDVRASMKAWIDPANILHIGGKPRFVIGIYDTTGFSFYPRAYRNRLAQIAQAPINMIINYFLTNCQPDAIIAYTTAMQQFGMVFLPTVNNFYTGKAAWPTHIASYFGTSNQDQLISDYVSALTRDRGAIGYYTCDECTVDRQPGVFHQYNLIKQHDPASVAFLVVNPAQIQYWRDTSDVFGVDPYPIGIPRPMSIVGDATKEAVDAVDNTRPVWTVIQFFQRSSVSHFPTQQELHDMSWTAIAEGAEGVFYWSYGIRGLHRAKRHPALMQQRYNALINVTKEIKSLEPALIDKDRPVLAANSAAAIVITKQKAPAGGARYVIAYNHGGDTVSVKFTLLRQAHTVLVIGEHRSISLEKQGIEFKDSFAPYQAHVYEIKG